MSWQNIDHVSTTPDTPCPEGVAPEAWERAVGNGLDIITVTEGEGYQWDYPEPTSVTYYAEVPHTTHGDYTGGLMEKANYAHYEDYYGEVEDLWLTRTWAYDTKALYINLHVAIAEGETVDFAWDEVLSLLDYPCVDEEGYSELERQVVEDYIAEYLVPKVRKLVTDEVADAYGDDFNYEVWHTVISDDRQSPYVEGLDGVVLSLSADEVADLLTENLPAWQQAQTIHPDQLQLA